MWFSLRFYRPNASNGVWLCCLVPIAYLVSALKHQTALSDEYKYSLIIAFGLLFQSIEIYIKLKTTFRSVFGLDLITKCLPGAGAAVLISICLHQGKDLSFRNQIYCFFFPHFSISFFSFHSHLLQYFRWIRDHPCLQWTLSICFQAVAEKFYIWRGHHCFTRIRFIFG